MPLKRKLRRVKKNEKTSEETGSTFVYRKQRMNSTPFQKTVGSGIQTGRLMNIKKKQDVDLVHIKNFK